TDDTSATVDRYRSSLPLTVLHAEERLGYGRAVERLLREAVELAPYPKRDCAVVLQADFTEDPADLETLVKAIEGGADIVSGSEERNGHPRPRAVRVARWMAPLVLGRAFNRAPVSDPLCGFRAYRIIVLKKAFRDDGRRLARTDGRWGASLELLGALAPHARRIEESPVALRYDLMTRESRFHPVRVLRDLIGLRGMTYGSAAGDGTT
ncbi:MAG TPA: glycosyltransferase, partial [Longimicrobiales bacterium]|nr:glycosyltransferase [Longimicrobiales bacterium]